MRNILIIVVVLVVLGGGFLLFSQNKSKNSADNSACAGSLAATSSATIAYSNSGFSSDIVTVKAGGNLTVKNDSDRSVEFNSDPHPVHTDNPELNIGAVEPGGSKTITVNTTGCWGFHNHLNPTETGTLKVE